MNRRTLLVALIFTIASAACTFAQSQQYLDDQLFGAVIRGEVGKVKDLVRNGANVNAKGSLGNTPLGAAANEGNLEIVAFLIEHGADVNPSGFLGSTVLMSAVLNCHAEVVRYLVQHGADINAKGFGGDTAFTSAAAHGATVIVEIFLDKGADIETKNGHGQTMLMLAADGNYSDTVSLLLRRHAQREVGDIFGRTALMAAAEKGNLDIVRLLVGAGAIVNQTDASGHVALDYAAKQNNSVVTNFLRDKTDLRTVLNECVATLQNTDYNHPLREHIIELALTLNPPVSADAQAHFDIGMKAMHAVDSSTSSPSVFSSYSMATAEFHKAANLAPWYAAAYYEAALAQAGLGKRDNQPFIYYDGAATDLGFYLLAAPNDPNIEEVRRLKREMEAKARPTSAR
jgi:ankyrin repeat protein